MPAPAPIRTAISAPFWEGLERGEIVIQRCAACRRHVFYPRAFCHHCGSRELSWHALADQPVLYSFSVADVPVAPELADQPVQIPIIVEIADVRLASTLEQVAPEEVRIGMALAPLIVPDGGGGLLLKFRPA